MATRKPLVLIGGVPTALPASDNIGLQPLNALLTAVSGLAPLADQMLYFTGASSVSVSALSSFSRTQLANADAATWRTNLAVAALASPTFTGTPAAPTAAADTNTTQLATTAFVLGQATNATPLMSGTAAVGMSVRFARADHVHPTDTSRAPLESPTFTGTPAAPTATDGTFTTQLATTAFVQNAVGGYLSITVTGGTYTLTDVEASNPVIAVTGTLTANQIIVLPITVKRLWAISNGTTGAYTVTVKTASGNGVTITQGKRNLVYTDGTNVYDGFNDYEDIALTGTPTAPTAALATNNTQVATTAFVVARISNDAVVKSGGSTIGDGTAGSTQLLTMYRNSSSVHFASAGAVGSYANGAVAGTFVIRNHGDGTTPGGLILAGSTVKLGASDTTAANYPTMLTVDPTSITMAVRPTFNGETPYDTGNLAPNNPPTQITGATGANGNQSFWIEEDPNTGEGYLGIGGWIGGIGTVYDKNVNLFAKDSNGVTFYTPLIKV